MGQALGLPPPTRLPIANVHADRRISMCKSNVLYSGRSGRRSAVGLWPSRTQITWFSLAPGGLSRQQGRRADRRIRRVLQCWRRDGWASVRGRPRGTATAPPGHRQPGRPLADADARRVLPAPGLTARRRPARHRPARLPGPRPLRPRPGSATSPSPPHSLRTPQVLHVRHGHLEAFPAVPRTCFAHLVGAATPASDLGAPC